MNFVVPEAKVVNYLLIEPGKRGFFIRVGYTLQNWTRLRDDIFGLTQNASAIFIRNTIFGKKYQITGNIQTPDGRTIKLTTAWIVLNEDADTARLVTAYPA